MKFHSVRILALGGLVSASVALWGCQELSTTPGTSGGPTTDTGNPQDVAAIQQVVEAEAFTAAGTSESDIESSASVSFSSIEPGVVLTGDSLRFHRVVLNSTRTRTVTQSGDVATVTIMEDRSGTLKIGRRGIGVQLERPFSDHGTRSASLVRRGGHWQVSSSSFMDRKSTLVASPVGVAYVEFTPAHGVATRYSSPAEMLERAAWPMVPRGTVSITVKLDDVGSAGARVFLHDRSGDSPREHHKIELTRDDVDATLFRGTWTPSPQDASHERAWRRLLTVDAFDAATLSLDPSVAYNAHQWVMPVAFRATGERS